MRILALTHRLPYAPNRGDRLRVYHTLQYLRAHADVDLVSLVHDDDEAAHVDDVRSFVSSVAAFRVAGWRTRISAAAALASRRPLTHVLLDAPGISAALRQMVEQRRPDVVFSVCSGMARFALQPPLDAIPMVLDLIDVDSQKWRELARKTAWPLSWIYQREAATLGAFEALAATRAAAALVVNGREADLARSLAPEANVHVIPNGIEIGRLRPLGPPSRRPGVVFCGVMNYAPNDEGMQWFVQNVWPLVTNERPDATLSIVGADPTPRLQKLCRPHPSITVTGRVDDVRDWLWNAAVGIAPLQVARGVQNKALEAIAAGLPIVVTEAVAAGLPHEASAASLIAESPRQFADHVIALLRRSPEQRRAIASAADFDRLTWARTLAPLYPILHNAAQTVPARGPEVARHLVA